MRTRVRAMSDRRKGRAALKMKYVHAKADNREHSRGYFRMIVGFYCIITKDIIIS
jgi:hypothetical protein